VGVSGGHGACLKQILDDHLHLEAKKCILQGTPEVIKIAKSDGNLPVDLVLMEHDFGAEQPVKGLYWRSISQQKEEIYWLRISIGAKASFMRMMMHNYADPVRIDILAQPVKAMAPGSRVLIADMLIP
jgi:hypothetical protein